MKILVLWANPRGNANLGVSVLAEGAAEIARAAFGSDVEVAFQEFSSASDGPGLSRRMFLEDLLRFGNGPIARRLRAFDLILDTGAGDSFTDHYGISRLAQIVYAQLAARRINRPLVLMPQTIGPFNSLPGKTLGRMGSRKATAIFTRDSESARAAEELGVPPQSGYTDVVFALPQPQNVAEPRDVIVNVSGLLGSNSSHVDSNRYMSTVRELIDGLLALGRKVSLLAHVVGPENSSLAWGDNDVPAVRHLAKELGDQVEVIVPEELADVRSILKQARLVIGSRMHACLNAMSVGTPAIAMAYSRKFEPLMSDLGWPHCVDLRADPNPAQTVLDIIQTHPEAEMITKLEQARQVARARTEAMIAALQEVVNA